MADILIIEDDLKLRTELQRHLEAQEHGVICASDGREGLTALQELSCDVAILDIRLPVMSGTEVLKLVHATLPLHPPIIIITGHGDKEIAIQSLHFGAFDFIEKPFAPHILDEAIGRAVTEKKQEILRRKAQIESMRSGVLTKRESEVATLASQGLTNEDIAQKLELTSETVKSHLKNIFKKLGVSNRTALSNRLVQKE
ncbi:MAG: response regulator transcription factor [Deltaproteobacteria bacterium]|nr:response regulator transcription factor [Deltaproteobacteria bacterium]